MFSVIDQRVNHGTLHPWSRQTDHVHNYPTNYSYSLHKYYELDTKRLILGQKQQVDQTTDYMCVVWYYVILFGCGRGFNWEFISNHSGEAIEKSCL